MRVDSSSCKAPPKPRRSIAPSSRRCWRSPKAGTAVYSTHRPPHLERPLRCMPDNARFADFAMRVGAFHITDRAMKRAQTAIERQLEAGTADDSARRAYLAAV